MADPYAGDPANYPATITVPEDGDAPNGVLFGTPYEELADRVAHVNARLSAHYYASINPASGGPFGGRYALTEVLNGGGFSYLDGRVTVPSTGVYEVSAVGWFTNSEVVNPSLIAIAIALADSGVAVGATSRFSTSAAVAMNLSVHCIVTITNTATQRISVVSAAVDGDTLPSSDIASQSANHLVIRQITRT